jgi:luciferase family oxidoreductase group 1
VDDFDVSHSVTISHQSNRVPLSVLDLATVGTGQSSRDALLASTELARAADQLGYRRFWVAEHHNMPGVASTSPPVLIAHLAAASERIRVGSGGVMLPNHAPLVVAEQFALLEALHPGRIDLGIGRAPGTDQRTALALRRAAHQGALEDFIRDILDVRELLGTPAQDGVIAATPNPQSVPQAWILGSSQGSAVVAAALGLPYAFAHHFSAGNTEAAVALYRERFQPSSVLDRPYVSITAFALVAETDERARLLAQPAALSWAELRQGIRGPIRTTEEAAAHEWRPFERELAEQRLRESSIGSPATVVADLQALVERTGADELMVAVQAHDVADRIATLTLLQQTWSMGQSDPADVTAQIDVAHETERV